MNNDKRVEFVGSIIIFFVLLFLYSKFGPSIPVSVLTQTKGEPMMVDGTGKVTVVPDIAKVNLSIEEKGLSLKTVQSNVDIKSKKLTAELEKMGIEKKDIQSTSYNVYPEYDYTSPSQRITGYRVSSSYEVKITDFEKVNDVLTSATSVGVNSIGGISLEVNEKTKKEKLQEAREAAIKEAKEKAEGLAKASGISLGKIINVTENTGLDYPRPVAYDKSVSLGMGGAPEASANIQPGESELQITVTISYEVR